MSAYLSPIGNEQEADSNGAPVSGALINTYVAGTTTPVTTYTDAAGLVPQANPIVCNSAGYPASPIFLPAGVAVKMVFTTSVASGSVAYRPPVDNIQGVNDPSFSTTVSEWTAFSGTPTFISTTSFSVTGDQTNTFQALRRLKSTNTGGTIYSSIATSAFGAGITTVTVTNSAGVLDSGLSSVSYGLLSVTNPSIPETSAGMALRTAVALDSGTLLNASLTASVSSSALTIALKTASGADPSVASPVFVSFRSATAGTGTVTLRSVTSPLSIVIPSTATMGQANTVAARLWVALIDNAGTVELAAANTQTTTGIMPVSESVLVSTTILNTASDNAGVWYSTTARTGVAMRLAGYVENTQAVAGTWATTPSVIQTMGPGVKMPGDRVQMVTNYVSAAVSTSSATLVDATGMTASITPTSAVNRVLIAMGFNAVVAPLAATNVEHRGMPLRGSTQLSTIEFITGSSSGGGGNGASVGQAFHLLDAPASTSATTYKLQHRTSNVSASASTGNFSLVLEEVMA